MKNEIKIQTANTIRVVKVEGTKDKHDVTFVKSVVTGEDTESIKVNAQLVCLGEPGEFSISEDYDLIRGRRFPADTRRSIEKQINAMLNGELTESKPKEETPKAGTKLTKDAMSNEICTGLGELMLELRKEFKAGDTSLDDVTGEIKAAVEGKINDVKATKKPFGFTYEYEGETRQFFFEGRGKNAVNPATRLV